MNQYLEKYIRRGKKREKTNRGLRDLLRGILPERKEGQSGEEYAKQRMLWGLKCGVYALAMLAVVRGVLVTAKANISVSNSVNGKELPIYCVETAEPKVALTFDAAWGNEDTAQILEILKILKILIRLTGLILLCILIRPAAASECNLLKRHIKLRICHTDIRKHIENRQNTAGKCA